MSSSERKALALVLLLAFTLRLLAALHFQSQVSSLSYLGYDESVYYSLARQMSARSPFAYTLRDAPLYGQSYVMWYLKEPLFHHPPLFVWVLYIWQRLFGLELMRARLLNVLLGTGIVYITYLIGKRLTTAAALHGSLFIALSALSIQQSALLLVDTPLTFLTTLFILAVIRLYESPSRARIGVAGLVLGLTLWTKYMGAIAIVFLLALTAHRKVRLRHSLLVLLSALLLFSPWLLWNQAVYGLPLPAHTWQRLASFAQTQVPFYSYLLFLPVLNPYALPGYAALLRSRSSPLKASLASFVAALFLFTALITAREARYMLPSLSPLAILAADHISRFPGRWGRLLLLLTLGATALASAILAIGGYHYYLPFWYYGL